MERSRRPAPRHAGLAERGASPAQVLLVLVVLSVVALVAVVAWGRVAG